MQTCIPTDINADRHVYVHTCAHTYADIYTYMYMYICMCAYILVYTRVFMPSPLTLPFLISSQTYPHVRQRLLLGVDVRLASGFWPLVQGIYAKRERGTGCRGSLAAHNIGAACMPCSRTSTAPGRGSYQGALRKTGIYNPSIGF